MRFDYACFISYCHSQGDLVQSFVHQVKHALTDQLGPYSRKKVVVDKDLLEGGDLYNISLAEAICRSICMIVIYSPLYDKSPYCQRELKAMQTLQARRLPMLPGSFGIKRGRGLIIPLVLRGWDSLPDSLQGHIHSYDFSRFFLAQAELRLNLDHAEKFRSIAGYIAELEERFEQSDSDPCADCGSFELPPESEVVLPPPKPPARDLPFSGATA